MDATPFCYPTGPGQPQGGSPQTDAAYERWLIEFTQEVNARWLDRHTGRDGIPRVGDLVRSYQVTNHLFKWADGYRRYPEGSGANYMHRLRYVSIEFARRPADLTREAQDYTDRLAQEKWSLPEYSDDVPSRPMDEPTARRGSSMHTEANGKATKPPGWLYEQLPPHNLEAEQSVIAGMLLDNELIPKVREAVNATDFYRDTHQTIIRTLYSVYDARGYVDGLSLADELKRFGMQDADELVADCLRSVPHARSTLHHADIVRSKATSRRLIEVSTETLKEAYGGSLTAEQLRKRFDVRCQELGRSESQTQPYVNLTDEEMGLVAASGVEPAEIRWLWPDRFPLGKVSLIAGEGGIGKSFLTLSLAAIVSRGWDWPDRDGECTTPGDVILLSAEDDINDTIVPRLISAGADLERVRILQTGRSKAGKRLPVTLADMERLEEAVKRVPEPRLMIVDTMPSFVSVPGRRAVDDNKNSELRLVLDPLRDFAAEHALSLIGISHFNKSSTPKNAVHRIIGSVAYVNAARAVFAVIWDPDNETRRLMLPAKANLTACRSGLGFTIDNNRVVWERQATDVRLNDVIAAAQDKDTRSSKLDAACDWLMDFLNREGESPSEEVIAEAKTAGFGKDCVWKAKKELGICARKQGFARDGKWLWTLPPISAPDNTPESF